MCVPLLLEKESTGQHGLTCKPSQGMEACHPQPRGGRTQALMARLVLVADSQYWPHSLHCWQHNNACNEGRLVCFGVQGHRNPSEAIPAAQGTIPPPPPLGMSSLSYRALLYLSLATIASCCGLAIPPDPDAACSRGVQRERAVKRARLPSLSCCAACLVSCPQNIDPELMDAALKHLKLNQDMQGERDDVLQHCAPSIRTRILSSLYRGKLIDCILFRVSLPCSPRL